MPRPAIILPPSRAVYPSALGTPPGKRVSAPSAQSSLGLATVAQWSSTPLVRERSWVQGPLVALAGPCRGLFGGAYPRGGASGKRAGAGPAGFHAACSLVWWRRMGAPPQTF